MISPGTAWGSAGCCGSSRTAISTSSGTWAGTGPDASASAVRQEPARPAEKRTRLRIAASCRAGADRGRPRSEEHTSELQSRENLVCRLLLEKKKKNEYITIVATHALSLFEV